MVRKPLIRLNNFKIGENFEPLVIAEIGINHNGSLDLAISIDNGVMHMMSLAKVPMIVLFGPTNSDKFAPNHDNTIILDSNKLYKTKDISKIRVEDLLKYID